jgi:hypothetical protein
MSEIINRVARSGIQTIDLEDFFPREETVVLDVRDWLFHGLILKEADFRQKLEEHDWSQYAGKIVLVQLSTDAVVPVWAYMLLASRLEGISARTFFGSEEAFLTMHYEKVLDNIPLEDYRDARVVIKGCGEKPVPLYAYIRITELLQPVVKSIMYGEPCSTVPVYKKKK